MSSQTLDSAVTNIEETSAMSAGAVQGSSATSAPLVKNKKLAEDDINEEEDQIEEKLREHIREKITLFMNTRQRSQLKEENILRKAIRQILKESDVSDMHPHRSTGINTLEDLLKKVVPTLRTDYKRLTTDKSQRDSFRAHMLKAIKDSLLPSLVNDRYGRPDGENTPLIDEPGPEGQEIEDVASAQELGEVLQSLDEIDVDIEDDMPPDVEKKIPVEDDEQPSEEDAFGIEGEDETGRNMAFACNKKIQQYILDSFDSLANPEDKKIFVDYLITNVKLYFDKFEDELQTTVEEPTTPEYEKAKGQIEGGI